MPKNKQSDPPQWVRNYINSIEPAKIQAKLKPKISQIIDKGRAEQGRLAWLMHEITMLCNQQGVLLELIPMYVAYAEELYYRARTLEWHVDRKREYNIIRTKYEKKGLDPKILNLIDEKIPIKGGRTRI